MKNNKHKIITFRIEPDIDTSIEEVSKERLESKSETIRTALIEFIKRINELKEIKRFLAKRFAENKISFDELVRLLGYNEAKKIASYTELAKHSIQAGLE